MANVLKKDNSAANMKMVFIPRKNKNDTERYVAVNGDNMLIQTGISVKVPEKFAQVIENSQKQDAAAQTFIEMFANG